MQCNNFYNSAKNKKHLQNISVMGNRLISKAKTEDNNSANKLVKSSVIAEDKNNVKNIDSQFKDTWKANNDGKDYDSGISIIEDFKSDNSIEQNEENVTRSYLKFKSQNAATKESVSIYCKRTFNKKLDQSMEIKEPCSDTFKIKEAKVLSPNKDKVFAKLSQSNNNKKEDNMIYSTSYDARFNLPDISTLDFRNTVWLNNTVSVKRKCNCSSDETFNDCKTNTFITNVSSDSEEEACPLKILPKLIDTAIDILDNNIASNNNHVNQDILKSPSKIKLKVNNDLKGYLDKSEAKSELSSTNGQAIPDALDIKNNEPLLNVLNGMKFDGLNDTNTLVSNVKVVLFRNPVLENNLAMMNLKKNIISSEEMQPSSSNFFREEMHLSTSSNLSKEELEPSTSSNLSREEMQLSTSSISSSEKIKSLMTSKIPREEGQPSTSAVPSNEKIQPSINISSNKKNQPSIQSLAEDTKEDIESIEESKSSTEEFKKVPQNKSELLLNSSKDMLNQFPAKSLSSSEDFDINATLGSTAEELELLLFEADINQAELKRKSKEYDEFFLDDVKESSSMINNDLQEMENIDVDDCSAVLEEKHIDEVEENLFEGFENVSNTKIIKFKNEVMKFAVDTPLPRGIFRSLLRTLSQIDNGDSCYSKASKKKKFINHNYTLNSYPNKDVDDEDINVDDVEDKDNVRSCSEQKLENENDSNSVPSNYLPTDSENSYFFRKSRHRIVRDLILPKKDLKQEKESANIMNNCNDKSRKRSLTEVYLCSTKRNNINNSLGNGNKKLKLSPVKSLVIDKNKNHKKTKVKYSNDSIIHRKRSLRNRFRKRNAIIEPAIQEQSISEKRKRSLRNRLRRKNKIESSVQEQPISKIEKRSLRNRLRECNTMGSSILKQPIPESQNCSLIPPSSFESSNAKKNLMQIYKRKAENLLDQPDSYTENVNQEDSNKSVATGERCNKKLKVNSDNNDNLKNQMEVKINAEVSELQHDLQYLIKGPQSSPKQVTEYLNNINHQTVTENSNYPQVIKKKCIIEINYGPYSFFKKRVDSWEKLTRIEDYFAKTSEGIYQCYFCYFSSKDVEELTKHLNCHKVKPVLRCKDCSFASKIESSFIDHMKTHNHNIYICDECVYEDDNLDSFIEHKYVHSNLKTLKCNLCGYMFSRIKRLKKHVLNHDMFKLNPLNNKVYGCPCCLDEFSNSSDLRDHVNIHFTDDVLKCPLCSFNSNQLVALKDHLLSHTEASNMEFQCNYCNIIVIGALDMIYHLKSHEGMFPCYSCCNVFEEDTTLKEHKCFSIINENSSVEDKNCYNTTAFCEENSPPDNLLPLKNTKYVPILRKTLKSITNKFNENNLLNNSGCSPGTSTSKRAQEIPSETSSCFLKSEITERGLRIFNCNKQRKLTETENKTLKLWEGEIEEANCDMPSKSLICRFEDIGLSRFIPNEEQISSGYDLEKLNVNFKICNGKVIDDALRNNESSDESVLAKEIENSSENVESIASSKESYLVQNEELAKSKSTHNVESLALKNISCLDEKSDNASEVELSSVPAINEKVNQSKVKHTEEFLCRNKEFIHIGNVEKFSNGNIKPVTDDIVIDLTEEDDVIEVIEEVPSQKVNKNSFQSNNSSKAENINLENCGNIYNKEKSPLKFNICRGKVINSQNHNCSVANCSRGTSFDTKETPIENGTNNLTKGNANNVKICVIVNSNNQSKVSKSIFKICKGKSVDPFNHKCCKVKCLNINKQDFIDNGLGLRNKMIKHGSAIKYVKFQIFDLSVISSIHLTQENSKVITDLENKRDVDKAFEGEISALKNNDIQNLNSKTDSRKDVKELQEDIFITYECVNDRENSFLSSNKEQENALYESVGVLDLTVKNKELSESESTHFINAIEQQNTHIIEEVDKISEVELVEEPIVNEVFNQIELRATHIDDVEKLSISEDPNQHKSTPSSIIEHQSLNCKTELLTDTVCDRDKILHSIVNKNQLNTASDSVNATNTVLNKDADKSFPNDEVMLREHAYECNYCSFGTDKLFKLNIHLMIHSELKPFECSFCPDTFSHPKMLKAHMKRHAYED